MSDLNPLDKFDRITSHVPMVSPFQTMWNAVEEDLDGVRAEGFAPEDIGRMAFNRLSEDEKDKALDVLFYTHWAATLADREARAAFTEGGAA